MSPLVALRATLGRFVRDRGGSPAVEFALTAPVLALIILGIVAIGFEASARIDAREAVRAGAHAVMAGEEDTNVIRQIVLDALERNSESYTVEVTVEYRCAAVVVAEDTPCANGAEPQVYYLIGLNAVAGAAYIDSPPISATMEVRVA